MVDEAVDGRERHGLVGEDLAPFAERLIGRDQHGAAPRLELFAHNGLAASFAGGLRVKLLLCQMPPDASEELHQQRRGRRRQYDGDALVILSFGLFSGSSILHRKLR